MPSLVKTVVRTLAACGACVLAIASSTYAAQGGPVGAWRTVNNCFLIAFILSDGGRAQAAYMTGEQDSDAKWTWDGSTLTITSMTFPLDRFTGHLANDQVEAEYVWHDLDRDQLNSQNCMFERFTPFGL